MALDPVCGMTVEPASAAGKSEYQGTTYYFCSQHCLHAFTANPAKFAAGNKKEEEKPRAGVEYTCPMHPEIVQIGPGSCPKCGMALVPMGGVAADDDNPELRDHTQRFYVGSALSIPLVFIAMAPMLGVVHPLGLG